MKIYLLWMGEYEDRDVYGIYKTPEQAKQVLDELKKDVTHYGFWGSWDTTTAYIEEWEIDTTNRKSIWEVNNERY